MKRRAVIVAEAERRSSAVNAPLMVEMVDEVDLNPLLVNSLATVILPPDVEMVDVPDNPPPAVTQNGKLLVVMTDEVVTVPFPVPVEVLYLLP